jgi:aryl-alcohol dehydrogenase-like predicted oxidoreductase
MHGWDPITPIEETLSFLDAAVRAGKIHYIGLSNYTGWQLQLAVSTARSLGMVLPVTLQQQYSLACREIEYEVIPAALHNDIGLLPWSPLAHGFLSGKFTRGRELASGTRLGSDNAMYMHIARELTASDRNWATVDTARAIAKESGATASQIALSWIANRPGVAATIIGARTLEQLRDNLGAADLELTADATARLEAVSAPRPDDYPYGRFGTLQRDRYIDSSDQALREL